MKVTVVCASGKAAGLVDVSRRKEGIYSSRPLQSVRLYDVYEAVESVKGKYPDLCEPGYE